MGKKVVLRIILIAFIVFRLFVVNTVRADSLSIEISGNGSSSSQTIEVDSIIDTDIVQENNATIENNVDSTINTGDNEASANGGNVDITTGDGEDTITVENSVINSNYVAPPNVELTVAGEIVDNGEGSDNEINLNFDSSVGTSQINNAAITTEINSDINTGENTANNNIGDVSVETGDIVSDINITNADINTSVDPVYNDFAIDISIGGNGFGSTNTAVFGFSNSVNNTSYNNAAISNVINQNLNTGGNSANNNLGGISIISGDIQSVINILNNHINSSYFDPFAENDGVDGDGPGDTIPDPGTGGVDLGSGTDDGVSDVGSSDDDTRVESADSSPSTGGAVLGLSNTSSGMASAVVFWLGILSLIFGAKTTLEFLYARK